MHSKRSLEGYLLIENRHAPAIQSASAPDAIGVGVSGVMEAGTVTCSHCQRILIVQPLRTRDRPYCRRCDHYICDDCALEAKLNGGECLPYTKKLDLLQERAIILQSR